MSHIRVTIVEDNSAMRDGLAMILNSSPGFACLHTCASAEDALERIPQNPPDVVLMDINLPRKSGIECVRQLTAQLPQLQVIMLTIEENSERVFESLEAGASGYLVKTVPPTAILAAIEEVHRGGSPMSSQIARLLVQSFRRRSSAQTPEINLTAREEEILRLIATGCALRK